MKRLIKAYVFTTLANLIAIRGVPLNEATHPTNDGTEDNDAERAKTHPLTPKDLKHFDAFQNATHQHKMPEPADQAQLQLASGKEDRKLSPGQSYCRSSPSMLNLFNTAALAESTSFHSSCAQTAYAGCDGVFFESSYLNLQHPKTAASTENWSVTFSSPTSIRTVLFIYRDSCCQDRIKGYKVTFGNNSNVNLNPICVELMTDGGWYLCPTSMIGTTFGLYTTGGLLINFVEVMAYSQQAIQMLGGVTVSFTGTNDPAFPVSNALQKIVVLQYTQSSRQKCVVIYPPAGGKASMSLEFLIETHVKAVVALAGYTTGTSTWPSQQQNVAIFAKLADGTWKLCGVFVDYYKNYSEVVCDTTTKEIMAEQQDPAKNLMLCGFGVLSDVPVEPTVPAVPAVDCDCAKSKFSTTPKPLASKTFVQITSADPVESIQISQVQDSVSQICGLADGLSKCGPRQLSFSYKLSFKPILQWPYKGYNFDSSSWILTLDPALADNVSVLTVTISLTNYPFVEMSQDVTAIVAGGKNLVGGISSTVKAGGATAKPVFLPTFTIKVNQNETAIFDQLPTLPFYISESQVIEAYQITSAPPELPPQKAKMDGNLLIVEASNVPLGDYPMTISSEIKVLVQVELPQKNTTESAKPTIDANLFDITSESFSVSTANFIASAANSTALESQDTEPAVMRLKNITNRGLLTLTFSKEVFKIQNVTDWRNFTEIFVKQSGLYSYKTSFTILNMTSPLNLKIQLNFSAPLNVSADKTPDKLYVWFNHTMFTRSNQLPVVYLNNSIDIPTQLSGKKYEEMMVQAVTVLVEGMNSASATGFVTSMFVNLGLQQVLGDIKGLTVICTLYCANLEYPALARQVGSQLLQFVQFDLFNCNPLYDRIFGEDDTVPYNDNFAAAGYGSRRLVRIMGTIFVFFFVAAVLSLLLRILLFATFLPAQLRSKIKEFLDEIFWNKALDTIKQNYIMLVMGSLLEITNIGSSVPARSSRRLQPAQTSAITGWQLLDFPSVLQLLRFQETFSCIVFSACIAVPIALTILSHRNFEQMKDKKSPQSLTWGAQIRQFRIPRVLTPESTPAEQALNEFRLTKVQAIIAMNMSYIYELLLVLALLYLNDYVWAQITALNIITIGKIIFFAYYAPFEDAGQNRKESLSQFLILIFVVTARCFTDWVPDTNTRQWVVYAQIALLMIFVLSMIVPVIQKALKRLQLVCSVMSAMCQRKTFLTDLAFVFRDSEFFKKCFQNMAEKYKKDQLPQAVEMSHSVMHIQSDSQLIDLLDQSRDPTHLGQYKIELLVVLRVELDLKQPKKLIQTPFSQISSHYRSELATFKVVQQKNFLAALEVLAYVRERKWPFGMGFIQDIKRVLDDWDERDMCWKWLDCVPLDFFKMKTRVQRLFVRNILLRQLSESEPDITTLEVQFRLRESYRMSPAKRQALLKKFQGWHIAIDEFEEFFEGRYRERMEILNSSLESWPVWRLQSFLQQIQKKRAKSRWIGNIETLQDLHMVSIEIVAESLDQPQPQIQARLIEIDQEQANRQRQEQSRATEGVRRGNSGTRNFVAVKTKPAIEIQQTKIWTINQQTKPVRPEEESKQNYKKSKPVKGNAQQTRNTTLEGAVTRETDPLEIRKRLDREADEYLRKIRALADKRDRDTLIRQGKTSFTAADLAEVQGQWIQRNNARNAHLMAEMP